MLGENESSKPLTKLYYDCFISFIGCETRTLGEHHQHFGKHSIVAVKFHWW